VAIQPTVLVPSEQDYCEAGLVPIICTRIGNFQSSEVIFVTYSNAGLRVLSVANPFRPEEIVSYVPTPAGMTPSQPIASADVFVDRRGLVYLTDAACGLHILDS
jgi:hypothetical protein